MKVKQLFSYFVNLLGWIFVISALVGCTSKNTIPLKDMPISEFMIGEWKVISRVNTDTGEALEDRFPTISIYSKELSYGDTHRAEYSFIEEDLIFVDNKRLTGGETWRLEKDNGNLIVYQEFQGFKSTIRLERVTR